jgi:hypothetical protein
MMFKDLRAKEKKLPFAMFLRRKKLLFGEGGGIGSSQLFAYFCSSRLGLEPNSSEKQRIYAPLPTLPYAFITCNDMQFKDSIILTDMFLNK